MADLQPQAATSALIVYRLVASPFLRDEHRSAKILGALARMELGPVTCAWFSRRTGLTRAAALALLDDICLQGCAQRIRIPCAESETEAGEPSRSSWFDLLDVEGGEPQPRRSRLQSAYQLLRRALR